MNLLLDPTNFMFFMLIIVYITISYLFLIGKDGTSKKNTKAKAKFVELIYGNIENDNILDLEMLAHIKQSVERQFNAEIIVSNMLQDVLVAINDTSENKNIEKRDEINEKIKHLIVEERTVAPFENLPEEERRLMRSLRDSIKHSDESSIKFYFEELNTAISVRHEEYTRAMKVNKWSVPLAFIGVLLTIVFGIIGISGSSIIG